MTLPLSFFLEHIHDAISTVELLGYEKVHTGKVRDTFIKDGKRILIATDRHSSFDRALPSIPFKGQVLSSVSHFWFHQTKDIVPNHIIATPDPSVSIVKNAKVFPVEFVIRAYMTGSTETSIWKNYEKGVRKYCGIDLPEGLQKNGPLPEVIITPTTKPESGHDELISPAEIVAQGLMTQEEWDTTSAYALAVFKRGQGIADARGLILVDTKFEFGIDEENGEIILVDEILTPDSSRWWKKETYQERFEKGENPQSFDKEFLRLWYTKNCDPYHDEVLPTPPPEMIARLAHKYAEIYEIIIGKEFIPELGGSARIQKNLDEYFSEIKK